MKAVVYARYSSDNRREESIEGQLRDRSHRFHNPNRLLIGETVGLFFLFRETKNEESVGEHAGLLSDAYFLPDGGSITCILAEIIPSRSIYWKKSVLWNRQTGHWICGIPSATCASDPETCG